MSDPLAVPRLEAVCEIVVELGATLEIGETRRGLRRVTPILGGELRGLPGAALGEDARALHAEILPGGGDRQLVRPSAGGVGTVVEIDARYDAQSSRGALIGIRAKGVRRSAAPESPETGTYFRVAIEFETADPQLTALQDSFFVADGVREENRVLHTVYRVA